MELKKLAAMVLLSLVLTGCAAEPVFESVTDVYVDTAPDPGIVRVMVPEKAAVLTAAGETESQLYFCDGYTLTVQTLAGGDLDRSIRNLTGYGRDRLTVLETMREGIRCYTCAWTSAGESGDQVGRLVLLDDGCYHYAVTVMATAEQAGMLTEEWEAILNRVNLSDTDPSLPGTALGTAGSRREDGGS